MLVYGDVKFGPVTEKVLPACFNWRNDITLYNNFRQYKPLTWEDHVSWFKWLHKNPSVQMFIVGIDDDLCGMVGLTSIDRVNSRAEISCYVISKYAEREEDVLAGLIKYGFKRENLNSLYAEVFETNKAKIDILNKLTNHCAILPKRYFREGKYIDSHFFTIVR